MMSQSGLFGVVLLRDKVLCKSCAGVRHGGNNG